MTRLIHRPTDVIARYGGEEFVVILPETNLRNARRLGESLCLGLESQKIAHQYSPAGSYLTMSVGIASMAPEPKGNSDELCCHLLEQADKALYDAKRLGRNQIVCAE